MKSLPVPSVAKLVKLLTIDSWPLSLTTTTSVLHFSFGDSACNVQGRVFDGLSFQNDYLSLVLNLSLGNAGLVLKVFD